MEYVFFIIVGFFAFISSLCVILFKNPIKSVLALILTFFLTAILWLILKAEFLAILLIVVYVGAVMVLFLFAIMLLHTDVLLITSKYVRYGFFFFCISVFLFMGVLYSVMKGSYSFEFTGVNVVPDIELMKHNVKLLGYVLYSSFLVEFEIVGILLLLGIVLAITLIFRGKRDRKVQDPSKQIEVSPRDRISVLSDDKSRDFK